MKIALDVDGVLADVIESWLIHNNKYNLRKNDITEWNFWEKFQINRYDFYNQLSNCWKSWESIPTTENTLSTATKQLSELAEVDIVTAREYSTNEYVKKWLEFHNIHYQNYISVIDGPQKAKLDYDIFIDDSPINAKTIVDEGKKILLYSQPWNTNLDNSYVNRITRLSDAVNYIQSTF